MLRVSVRGIHCDSRLGSVYMPIVIVEEVFSDEHVHPTAPIRRGKQITSCEDSDDDDDDSETLCSEEVSNDDDDEQR